MNPFIIIPAFNEEKHIGHVIRRIKAQGFSNIIVVDDGSQDKGGCVKAAEDAGAVVLRHAINLGKGCALRTGCDFALRQGATHFILMDADGQHDPKELLRFTNALKTHDIVFGSRRYDRKMPFIMRFGNTFINSVAETLFGISLKDTQSGFRAMSANAYRKVRWNASDYSVESEMIANASAHQLRYKELMIENIYREKYKGTTIFDGIKIVSNMLWWKLAR
ncbi:glycosyltransferase family 2 protein [Candidatus Woesearchaeota archaeon]|nr:glycosyltransferase family 2 protein [Candidatus Woesearchaeota archaeon]